MKKLVLSISLLALLMSFLGVASVRAQGTVDSKAPGTWASSINIQNVGTGAATVQISFYNTAGASVMTFSATPDIPVGGSRSYYVPATMTSLAAGQYSAIVASSQPVQVVTNAVSSGPLTSGAYSGVPSTEVGTTLNFPGLYKNYYGFFSEIVLMNTTATAATNVNLTFFSQKTGTQVATVGPVSIPASASRIFAMQDLSGVPSGNSNGLLSVKVVSDQALAGIANVWSSAGAGQFSDYNGLVSGSTTTLYAPALYNSYYGFNSALTVQNLSSSQSANIRVTYSNGVTATATLSPTQAVEYYQPAVAGLPSGNATGVFSAKVETLNSVPIVALVSVNNGMTLASYNAASLVTTAGTNCAVVMKDYFGYFSAETVQNVGTLTTNITVNYSSGHSKTFNGVPPNGTVNVIELSTAGSALPGNSSVSASFTSNNSQPLVAVVQENRTTAQNGDTLLAYTCVAK